MKKTVAVILLSSLSFFALSEDVKDPTDRAKIIKIAEESISERMMDPYSVKFKDVEFNHILLDSQKIGDFGEEAAAVCGLINAKNQYGAYIGYRVFTVVVKDIQTDPKPVRYTVSDNEQYWLKNDDDAKREVVCGARHSSSRAGWLKEAIAGM